MKKKICDNVTINYVQRAFMDDVNIGEDLINKNGFIVEFPEEFGIRFYDVISVNYLGEKMCRFTIRNNSTNLPLFNLNNYKCKCCSFFKKKKSNIIIHHINKMNEIVYTSILYNVCVKNIFEEELTYTDDNPQNIIFDIKYKKRIIEKYATNKK